MFVGKRNASRKRASEGCATAFINREPAVVVNMEFLGAFTREVADNVKTGKDFQVFTDRVRSIISVRRGHWNTLLQGGKGVIRRKGSFYFFWRLYFSRPTLGPQR